MNETIALIMFIIMGKVVIFQSYFILPDALKSKKRVDIKIPPQQCA